MGSKGPPTADDRKLIPAANQLAPSTTMLSKICMHNHNLAFLPLHKAGCGADALVELNRVVACVLT